MRLCVVMGRVFVVLRDTESPRELVEAIHALDGVDSGGTRSEGAPVLRTYGIGAQILKDLGIKTMRVLSAPKTMHGLSAFDLEVESYVDCES